MSRDIYQGVSGININLIGLLSELNVSIFKDKWFDANMLLI